MVVFTREAEIVHLGKHCGGLWSAAFEQHKLSGEMGFLQFMRGEINRLPKLIVVKDQADELIRTYVEGIAVLRRANRPGWNAVEGAGRGLLQDWFGAGIAAARFAWHFWDAEKFKDSDEKYRSCSDLLEYYRLVSVSPSGTALVREAWYDLSSREGPKKSGRVGVKLGDKIRINSPDSFVDL